MRLTYAKIYFILAQNVKNRVAFPAGGAYDAPPDPLVVRGFVPSAIAASRLRRLHFPQISQDLSLPKSLPIIMRDILRWLPARQRIEYSSGFQPVVRVPRVVRQMSLSGTRKNKEINVNYLEIV